MKKHLILFLSILFFSSGFSQTGGHEVFYFLNFPSSARINGLGGNLITVRDSDASLAFANPALLNPSMNNYLSFNHSSFFAGINHGYFSFAKHIDKFGATFHSGIQYVNYGEFDATDITGQKTGEFSAAEYAITIGAGKQLYERMSIGANLKFITSQLESYNSLGLSADIAACYFDTTKNFTATFLMKNIGTQLSTYTENNREKLPFEIQVGISKKLSHLPFRFSIIYHNLQRWNILYDDPNNEETILFFGETNEESVFKVWFDNFSRHFIFNGEFLIGKKENLRFMVGYNHMRHKEMTVGNFRSFAGFSVGFGIKIYHFRLAYGRNSYHLAGGANHFSISTNLSEFRKNKLVD